MKKLLFVCILLCNQLAAQNIAQLEDQIKKPAFKLLMEKHTQKGFQQIVPLPKDW